MKFACPKCSTPYTIGDDRVPVGKTVSFTCKKCGYAVHLRRKDASVPADGSRRETVSGRRSAVSPKSGSPSAVASIGVQAQAAVSAGAGDGPAAALGDPFDEAPPMGSREEWFVLVKREQKGPMTPDKLRGMLARGEIAPRTYVWCDGMNDWKRLREVGLFSDPIAGAGGVAQKGYRRVTGPEPSLQELAPPGAHPPSPEPRAGSAAAAAAPQQSDPAVLAALAGTPTGERLTRDRAEGARPVAVGLADEVNSELPSTAADRSTREPADPMADAEYLSAPPGAETRVFMATAGLFKRRRRARLAASATVAAAASLLGVILLDISGVIQLPGMGFVYDATGLEDPSQSRAVAWAEAKLSDSSLAPADRERLRKKLLGLGRRPGRRQRAGQPPAAKRAAAGRRADTAATRGIEEPTPAARRERELIANVFGDQRKAESAVRVAEAVQIRTPNLPDGLTQEAIFKVVEENKSSMSLCIAESRRKGERLDGRMEVEFTIQADGRVSGAEVSDPRFRGTTIGFCTVRRARGWRFPRFNGKPVTVIFPYVLSTGL